jgi:hypothetical protein
VRRLAAFTFAVVALAGGAFVYDRPPHPKRHAQLASGWCVEVNRHGQLPGPGFIVCTPG